MNIINTINDKLFCTKRIETQIEDDPRFNTFFGVFLPSILSILGVILYLRLSYIVGAVGIIQTTIIIFFSSLITFITGLSIAATATNMDIKGGGAYYMISRSFGIEIGSAIGIALYVAQVIGVAFYIEGFSEALKLLFPDMNSRLVETTLLMAITLIASVSARITMKTQLYIFILICFSLMSILIGSPTPLEENDVLISGQTLSFWTAFALFFPAVTGIEAGFSMSGDLKDPKRSLPIGTLSAVMLGFFIYLILAFYFWFKVPYSTLLTDSMIVFKISRYESLVMLGIWGATLSCTIGGILAAPRTLQAIAKDKIVPSFIGKGFGTTQEPRIAILFTFVLVYICLYVGDINILAPILTMFFLISYGILNLAAGLESLFGNPSWRPTFSTPSIVSLLGSVICLIAMLMIDSGYTLIALCIIFILYLWAKRKNMGEGWEDIRQGALLFFCRFAIYHLATHTQTVRSWRPNFLVFSSSPTQKTNVIEFANSITEGKGFLTVASIVNSDKVEHEKISNLERLIRENLRKNKIVSLVEVNLADDCYKGMKHVITTYGLGPITPNTIILGYSLSENSFQSVAEIVQICQELGKNLLIFKDDGTLSKGPVTVWWDDDSRSNSELMLVIAHMLQSVQKDKCQPIQLKSIVPCEDGRQKRMDYFHEFFARSRLNVEVKVLVVPDDPFDYFKTVSRFSSESSMIYLGLREFQDNETPETYGKYLKELMAKSKHLKKVVYVLGSEKIGLTKIFEYSKN